MHADRRPSMRGDQWGAGLSEAVIECIHQPLARVTQDAQALVPVCISLKNGQGLITAAVVDRQQLKILEGLGLYRGDTFIAEWPQHCVAAGER